MKSKMLVSAFLLLASAVSAQQIDTQSDTWAATDALGRNLPAIEEAGAPREGKKVGIFYFLWNGQHGTLGPFNISEIMKKDPDALRKPESPLWGPKYRFHHWGEPLFGYYLADDPWVLRKHAQMLSDAGVDVVIFDVSNQSTYPNAYLKLCEVWTQVRREGGKTPQIAFFCPFGDTTATQARLFKDFYRKRLYPDLWFCWERKPVILAPRHQAPEEMQVAFTFRPHGPDYFNPPTAPDQWQWSQIYPQHPYHDKSGKIEEVSVSVAVNASGKRLCAFSEADTYGRSWHDGKKDPRPDAVNWGFQFAEQWEHALKVDPDFIYVTGWNEWIALRLPEFHGVCEPVMFVDQFTQEYSRDAEPMRGGHWDNYYYQLADCIRRFKGVRPAPAAPGPFPVTIDGKFDDWDKVTPEYRDDRGDVMHRNHRGYDNAGTYVNTTGRNDFVLLKVAVDRKNVCFFAQTAKPMTPSTDPRWMLLFIDADDNPATGWEGFDFRVNHEINGVKTKIQKSGKADTWNAAGEADYRAAGNRLEISIPRSALGLEAEPVRFTFKWADNIQKDNDAMEFTLNGDAAPNARFRYVFQGADTRSGEQILEGADERIARYRTGEAVLKLVGPEGQPAAAGSTAQIAQTNHAFLFGSTIFGLGQYETPENNAEYENRFTGLLNFATLPFYWWLYEKEEGKPDYARTEQLLQWCEANGVTAKGHPLAWNWTDPGWLAGKSGSPMEAQFARIGDCAQRFKGRVRVWDVVNEATHYDRETARENGPILTKAIQEMGVAEYVRRAFRAARQADPDATLIINDYRTDDAYAEKVIRKLVDGNGKPLYDAIGFQTHQHGGAWPVKDVWAICERFSQFGKPLHFTEVTFLSGDADWLSRQQNNPGYKMVNTPEGEQRQAEEVSRFYTLLYSHPSVEAITWWTVVDGDWRYPTAGLVRRDMSPKPVYDRLKELIKGKWWTTTSADISAGGEARFRGTFGDYRVTVEQGGRKLSGAFTFTKKTDLPIAVRLK